MVWYGKVWYSIVQYGIVQYSMVWYSIVQYRIDLIPYTKKIGNTCDFYKAEFANIKALYQIYFEEILIPIVFNHGSMN